jgi:hypothetical protein
MYMLHIKFNVVTWYSKLLSIIFFIAVLPVLTFYIGTQYQLTVDLQSGQNMNLLSDALSISNSILKREKSTPKIDIGESALKGKVYGMVQNIYEKDGSLWVNIDPADQVDTLECVFRAYDAGVSRECDAPNGLTEWNLSTSTIALPVSPKATLSVYYNDGTKIDLKPKVTTKNAKLYTFTLATSTVAKSYNRILSYDGDDTYRWNPLMYIEIQDVSGTSMVTSIEEVWKP